MGLSACGPIQIMYSPYKSDILQYTAAHIHLIRAFIQIPIWSAAGMTRIKYKQS